MSVDGRPSTPEEVVGKVLRRAEVAKMTRKLQDRLALASYKTKHGLDTLSFSLVEAHVESHLKRRRPGSSVLSSDDSSSSSTSSTSTATEHRTLSAAFDSSPISGPFFSDPAYDASELPGSQTKKQRFDNPFLPSASSQGQLRSRRSGTRAHSSYDHPRHAWHPANSLADSSPLQQRSAGLLPDFRTAHGPNLSFVSTASTIPESPPFGPSSDPAEEEHEEGHEHEHDLPLLSFHLPANARIHASPPRTPPPTRSRAQRSRRANATGEEGADLLLYLATSPSPANPAARARIYAPSTPPSKHAALLGTPGAAGFAAGAGSSLLGSSLFPGYATPGQAFNFADFVNVTPSPAQAAFGTRTPGPTKTPREARRRLNFDALVPAAATAAASTPAGLGMELGGELGLSH